MVLKGLDAAILMADLNFPGVPGMVPPSSKRRILKWSKATEEERQEDGWKELFFDKEEKYKFILPTEEEKRIWETARLKFMLQYVLDYYGYNYARKFFECGGWHNKFLECGIDKSFFDTVPACECAPDKQCNLFCCYYKGRCSKD